MRNTKPMTMPTLQRSTPRLAMRSLPLLFAMLVAMPWCTAAAQQSALSVQQIMQAPEDWIGSWPGRLSWSETGETLYFWWNPDGRFESDSLFAVPRRGGTARQVSPSERRAPRTTFDGWRQDDRVYSRDFRRKLFTSGSDIYIMNRQTGDLQRLFKTNESESNPQFTSGDAAITFQRGGNVYRMDLESGFTEQLTDLRSGSEPREKKLDPQDEFLRDQQLRLFDYVREGEEADSLRAASRDRDAAAEDAPTVFRYGNKQLRSIEIDASGRFVSFILWERGDQSKNTMSVRLVTESGYPEEETWRSKVGTESESPELWIQDLERDTTYRVDLTDLPGIYDVPAYRAEQGVEVDSSKARILETPRVVWSPDGPFAVVNVTARDNKDRWIAKLDPAAGTVEVLDRQHDDAWIGGPGMFDLGWIPGTRTVYFQSEATGYSHLYTVDTASGRVSQLTDGAFEVFGPRLSRDNKSWTFTSSEGSPFERHFYQMPVNGGKRTRLTSLTGNNAVELNPDEKTMAMVYSVTNRPPEVYLENERVTHSPKDEWLSYDWRTPDIVHFRASDGVDVPAQLFVPDNPNGAAVIFVHGAGYLQNVHRWWSSYFREYMFNNMLTDLGYYVINVDYRASAGYGRDWRTAIYRHMGGRDLQDQVDASRYLNREFGIDPERIAMYGGSYGGFITLMALFTESEHFGAGAALRSVTDWAHYNHGYTSNILNTPALDSLAYRRSSPINFADGLEDPLLMPHGMLDNNVHFQDIIRLTQKLIELGKEDWELAVYPVERHGFTEPSSWTDEYRRILELIEETVGKAP